MSKRIVLWFLFFCLAAALPAWGRKEVKTASPRDETSSLIQVTGRVRLVGGGLLPELVITGQDREWYIAKEDGQKLRDLQQRAVTVEGIETVQTLTFANGLPAGERRTLRDIRIISVQ